MQDELHSETIELLGSSEATIEDYSDGKFWFHGTAIGNNDVTKGRSKIQKVWPTKTLEEASKTLEGRPLVTKHDNEPNAIVGKVTETKHDSDGVKYRAFTRSADMAMNIKDGLLDVSPRIRHNPISEMETDENYDALSVDRASFDNLSLVMNGAAPSNTAIYGEIDELSASDISSGFGDLVSDDEAEELAESAYRHPLAHSPVIDADISAYGYVVIQDQETNGKSIRIHESYLHHEPSQAYAVGIHKSTGSPDDVSGNLGANIGISQYFPPDEVIKRERVWLNEPLTSDQQLYAVLYHVDEENNKDIFRYGSSKAYDACLIQVDSEAYDSGPTYSPDPSYLNFSSEELAVAEEETKVEELEQNDKDKNVFAERIVGAMKV